jgi:hypothetical protein
MADERKVLGVHPRTGQPILGLAPWPTEDEFEADVRAGDTLTGSELGILLALWTWAIEGGRIDRAELAELSHEPLSKVEIVEAILCGGGRL